MILMATLTGCNLPANQGDTYNRPDVVEKAQIVLSVMSRKPLIEGQHIEFVVVDEVTGVPFQKEQFPMTQTEDGRYGLVYPVPVGTVITYYFQKVSPDGSVYPEVNAAGAEISFRRLYIDTPGLVKETIAGWTDDLPTLSGGEISGVIVSEELGEPLADILVSAGGLQTITDIDGKFTLYPLITGTHSLTAISMSGTYLAVRHDAQTLEGMVTAAEMVMIPSPWKK